MHDHLASSGLTLAQFHLLAHIASASDDSIAGLALQAGLDPSTLSRNLQVLARAGWIEITIAEADLRRRAVWLTETGARRLEVAVAVWRKAHDILAAAVDQSDVERIFAQSSRLAMSGPAPMAALS